MNLSKREYIALELLKKLAKNEDGLAVRKAYAMADEFIAESNKCEDDTKNHGLDSETLLDPVFSLNVEILEFSQRVERWLKEIEVDTIDELVFLRQEDNYWINPYNTTTLPELRKRLSKVGLSLDMTKSTMYDYDSSKYVKITKDNNGELMLRYL